MPKKTDAQMVAEQKAVTEQALTEQAKAPKKRRSRKDEELQKQLAQTLERHRQEVAESIRAAEEAETVTEPETETEEEALTAVNDSEDKEPEFLKEMETGQRELKNPVEGLNLTPDLRNMSLGKYMEKLLELSRAETRAIKELDMYVGDLKHKVETLTDQVKYMDKFERAVGFIYNGSGEWASPKRVQPCPHCVPKDSRPSVQFNRYEKKWMVICKTCWTRTPSADGPMMAIKYWNERKESEVSEMVNRPLSAT